MKKASLLLIALVSILCFNACKKEKNSPPDEETGPKMNTKEVKVVLPAGASADLSKLTIFTYAQSATVSADGKSKIPFKAGTHELAYLFDAANNMMMMGIISDANNEISITSTTEALLYLGMGIPYSYSQKQRVASIAQLKTFEPFEGLKAKLEEYFKADPTMLSKNKFMVDFTAAVDKIRKVNTIDILAKQIKVEEEGVQKGGIKINQDGANAENFNFYNEYMRRAHAFLYKTSFIDQNDQEKTRINNITANTPADQNMAVNGGTMDERQTVQESKTGPVSVPLANNEKQATYKVRIIGVGGNAISNLTSAESAKLEELWMDYFAFDLLMPSLFLSIENTDALFKIRSNGPDAARAFINEVKKHMTAAIINNVKNGKYVVAISDYMKLIHDDYYKKVPLYQQLSKLGNTASQAGNNWGIFDEDIEKENERIGQVSSLAIKVWDGIKIHLDKQLEQIHFKCNTMDEWIVKVMDNDVKISPRKSDVMAFTNHPLNVSATPALNTGETLEFEWKTAGTFGVLKNGTSEATSFTTTEKTINYYGKTTPNENNIERVVVTAYIKNGASRKKIGSDTATINVKKVRIVMKPNGATLSPKYGNSSLKLYLLNADGTDPIVNNSSVQYRVNWSTAGTYGHFAGGITQQTTTVNNITYNATDKEVKKGVETITAKVEFRITQGSGWSAWMHRETIVGKVNVENDVKVIYVKRSPRHIENGEWCVMQTVVRVPIDPNAKSYTVAFTDIPGYVGEEITTSFTPSNLASNVLIENGAYVVGNFASSQHISKGHLPASSAPGGAFVTIRY